MKSKSENQNYTINRVEPPSWWVGMNTPLQLMIHGKNLKGSEISVTGEGIKINKVHEADSTNYLFLDIEIESTAIADEYIFELTKGGKNISFKYSLDKRRRGSQNRKSFTPADMVYLIMPDRFANGNPEIDSTPDTVEKANRKKPFGRHGGDLQGIINHLDYLADLGATTLWITPPQLDDEKEQSYHGYACADFYKIDPRYGDNELYKKLVKEAHKHKLKVIMDAVPNHCGTAHWWMKDLPFKDWVHQHDKFMRSNYRLPTISDPNRSQADYHQTIDGWFDTTMPDMGTENPFVQQYFKQLYIWWVEWANLDGLRIDTFPYNEKHAQAEWAKCILEEYPNLNIVAECWHSSPAVVAYWDGQAKNTDGYNSHLPSVMDFPLQEAISGGLREDSDDWAGGMNKVYEAVAHDFLFTDPRTLLTFLDNHDIDRFADSVKGDKDIIKIGITLLATMRGTPQLYYGTEYGFQSADLKNGHGAARKDFAGGWEGDRKNLFTGKNRTKKETAIYEHTKLLFNWRKTADVIHKGKTTHYLPEKNTYSIFRYTDNKAVFVFVNPSHKSVHINWQRYAENLKGYSSGTNILDGKKVKIGKKFKVKARTSVVIELSK